MPMPPFELRDRAALRAARLQSAREGAVGGMSFQAVAA